MINFETNNLIIVAYPRMAGGKFLMNCLALSNKAVLQNEIYATKDLNGMLTSSDKINILRNRIKITNKVWVDLGMGCNFIGPDPNLYREYSGDLSIFKFNSLAKLLSNSNKLFFIAAHDPVELSVILKIWINARVIAFTNSVPFIKYRGGKDITAAYWKDVSGPKWPKNVPYTYNEFMACPQFLIDDVNKLFPDMYNKLLDCIERHPHDLSKTVFWDNNFYFSSEQTANEVEKLYKLFKLDGFNREYILEYHKLWIDKLNQLK